jgi:hypothetical protein
MWHMLSGIGTAEPRRSTLGWQCFHALHCCISQATTVTYAYCDAAAVLTPVEEPQEGACSSCPASPLNIHSLLNRPFRDVQREIISGFQVRPLYDGSVHATFWLAKPGTHKTRPTPLRLLPTCCRMMR